MATISQITANIANAQHSTGPITAAGKAHSASNSTKLGLYAKQAVLLTDEDRTAFAALNSSFHNELTPGTAIEHTFFAQIILAAWNLQRANRLEAELALSEGVDPLLSTNPTFGRIAIFRLRAERSLHKCLSEYRKIKAQRPTIEEDALTLPIIRNEPNPKITLAIHYPQSTAESMEKPISGSSDQILNPNLPRNRIHS